MRKYLSKMSFEDPILGQIWNTQVCLDLLFLKKYIKTCLKCVFLTKKFKEKKHHYVKHIGRNIGDYAKKGE